MKTTRTNTANQITLVKRGLKLKILLLLIAIVCSSGIFATTYYSKATGLAPNVLTNWVTNTDGTGTSPANWTTTGDIFILQAGHTAINATADWTVTGNVVINGTLTVMTRKLTCVNFTVNSGGTYSTTQDVTVRANLILNGATTFGRKVTVTGTTTVNGSVTFSGKDDKNFVGKVTVNSGGTWNETAVAKFFFSNGITNNGTFTANTGVHEFKTNAQTITGTLSIPNVKINGVNVTNNGSLTISTALSEGGTSTLTQGVDADLFFGGTVTVDNLIATASGNTVNYYGAAQTVKLPSSNTYFNLTVSGSGGKTIPSGTTVNGTYSIENGANSNTYSGTFLYGTNATLQYNAGSSNRTSGTEWPATFSASGGVIINGTGTITTSGAKALNCSIPLTINSGSKLTLGNTLNVGGDFTNAGTFNSGNFALTFGGNFTNTGTLTLGSSNITFGAGCTDVNQTISGFTTTGTVTMAKTSGTATFLGNVGTGALTINGSGGTLNLGTGLTHTFTNVTLTAGTLNGGSSTLNVSGNWTGTGSVFSAGTGTVVFNGSSAQAISASSTTFNNLTFSGAGTKTFSNAFTTNAVTTINTGSGAVLLPNSSTSTTFLLFFATTVQPSGTHGGTASGATYKDGTRFGTTTTGILNVTATTRMVITGTGTQTTGGCQTITITATIPGTTNTDLAYTGTHTLTFSGATSSPNATSPTINGTAFGSPVSLTFTNGVATATMCLYKVETAIIGAQDENGYRSRLTADYLNVNVTANYVPIFTTQPVGGLAGQTFTTQPVITVQDAYGNLDLSAQNITVAIGTNPSSGTLNGTKTVAMNTSNATATFTNLSINNAGTGYTLTSSTSKSGGGTSTSTAFNVNNPVPTLTAVSPDGSCSESAILTVTLTGTNFNSQSQAQVNGISRTANYVSSTELTTTLSAAENAAGGSYAFTVYNPTPGGGTSSAKNVFISKIVLAPTVYQPTCSTQGSITLNVSGGLEPYSYYWDDLPGITIVKDRSNLPSGNYKVTVTDALGCSAASQILVINNISCTGISVCQSDAASVFNTTPNPDVVTYNWTITPSGASIVTGQGTASITVNWRNAAIGTYTMCVTTTNDCGTSVQTCQDVYVTKPPAKAYADQICSGGVLNLFAEGGVSYSWTGPNSFTSNIQNPQIYNASSSNNGKYIVTVTDEKGCIGKDSVMVTVSDLPPAITGTVSNTTACGESDGSITITAPIGAFTYLWSNGATTQNLIGISSGTYTLTVTNTLGCSISKTFTVNDNGGPSLSTSQINVSCFGGNNGSVNLTVSGGGGTPYTYEWSNGETTEDISGLTAGTYSVVVTSTTGCTSALTVTITEPSSPIQASGVVTNINCFGSSTGSIVQTVTGGTPGTGYTYAWTGPNSFTATTKDISNRPAGTYTVIITDKATPTACTLTKQYTITQPAAALNATSSVTNVSCFGGSSGQIILTPAGGTSPYTYNWGGGITTKDRTGLSAGTYSVTITDSKGCTFTLNNISVTQPAAALSAGGSQVNVSCNGGNNGSIDLTVTGGTTGYTYAWSNGATTEDISGLTAGDYSVIVTDAKGCTTSASFTITEPAILTATAQVTNASCFGAINGAITLTVSGGTANYSYLWSNGATSKDISGIGAGYYTVVITDAKGCSTQLGVNVLQPTQIIVTGQVINVACNGSSTGGVNLTVTGGSGTYTYSWKNSSNIEVSTLRDLAGVPAGEYTVTVSDGSCIATSTYTITQNAALSLSALAGNVSCFGGSDGNINLSVTGGLAPYTFTWTGTNSFNSNSEDIYGIPAGTYNVTVKDNANCEATFNGIAVTQPALLTASIGSVLNVTCKGGNNGTATASASGGTAPYSYLWNDNITDAARTGLKAGTYTVTITDAKGCTAQNSVTITEPATAIELYATTVPTSSCGNNTGRIDLTVMNGTSPFSYAWTGPNSYTNNIQDITGLAEGMYSVTVTDNTGCTATLNNIEITKATALTVSVLAVDRSCLAQNGSVYAVVSGGVAPYTYSWTGGATTESLQGLEIGTYSVTVTDANSCTTNASGTVGSPSCQPPVAVDDFYSTYRGISITGQAGVNDSDPDHTFSELEFLPLSLPDASVGTVIWGENYDGSFIFIPAPGFSGIVQIPYRVEDPTGLTDEGMITIVVTPSLFVMDDVNTTFVNTPVNGNVLTNDVQPTGNPVTINTTPIQLPANGTVVLNSDGSYTYIPNPGYIGEDSFVYQLCDTYNPPTCRTATVTIEVQPLPQNGQNNPPVAVNDAFQGVYNNILQNTILANDFDVDGDKLTVSGISFDTSGDKVAESVSLNTNTNIYAYNCNNEYVIAGTINVKADGTFTFTPEPGYTGKVEWDYVMQDEHGLTDNAKANISICPNIKGYNSTHAINDAAVTPVNTPVTGNMLANDFDPENNTITVKTTPVLLPAHGSVTINTDGTYIYTPNTDFSGQDYFTYEICDNGTPQACDDAKVFIEVVPEPTVDNDPPVPVIDSYILGLNQTLKGNVLNNDSDPDNNLNMNSVTLISGGTADDNGTVTLNSDGEFVFVPNQGFSGLVSFIYSVCDLGTPVYCRQQTVFIHVLEGNQTFATDDAYIGNQNTSINGNLLTNDNDPQGNTQTLSTTPVVSPVHGTVTLNPNGTFTYIPNPGYAGNDQFVYEVCDNGTPVACDRATVYLNVVEVNEPPVAINDVNTTYLNKSVNGNVITNDYDPENNPLTVNNTPVSPPSNGNVILNANGTYTYTPNTGFTGEDTFRYSVCDNFGLCDTATVTIQVMPLPSTTENDAPVAVNDNYQGTVNKTVTGTVIANDLDADGNGLTVTAGNVDTNGDGTPDSPLTTGTPITVWGINSAGQAVEAGTLTQNADGTFTFVPVNGFTGLVTYTYTISDGHGGTDTAVVTITITADYANSTLAVNDAARTLIATPVSGNVIANDYDAQGNTVTVTAAKADTDGDGLSDDAITVGTSVGVYGKNSGGSTVAAGTLVQNANGTYTFTPAAGFTGEVSYTYTICDNGIPVACDEATVVITVYPAPTAGNDPPVAVNNSYLTSINTTVSGNVLPNDYDPDNDPLIVTTGTYDSNGDGTQDGTLTVGIATPVGGVSSTGQAVASAGTLKQNGDGTFTFEPANGFVGEVTYTYTISDNNGGTDTATVTITVTGGNTTFATDDSYIGNQNMPISGNLKANDNDPQGNTQTLSTTPVVSPVHGTVTLNPNGTFTYIPNPGYAGTDQFVYEVCDNGTPVACDKATVYLNVVAVNQPPVAINDVNTTFINKSVSGQVLTNDYDPENNPLTVNTTPVSQPAHGNVILNANGTYTYTPNTGFTGEDTFRYSVCDNFGLCDTATVTIQVMPLPSTTENDAPVAVNDNYQGTVNKTVTGTVIANDLDADGNELTVIADAAGMYDSNGDGTPDTQLPIGSAKTVGGVSSTGQAVANAGTLTQNANGSFSFVPVNGFTGVVTYTYTISDGHGGIDTAEVTITITADYANSTLAVNDAARTLIATPVSGNVIANDYDAQGNTVTVTAGKYDSNGDGTPDTSITAIGTQVSVTGKNSQGQSEAAGTLTLNTDGSYTFTPTATFIGDVTYSYTVCDNGIPVACDEATVVITVYPAPTAGNDPPVAVNNSYVTSINTTVSGNVLPNDYDPDGDMLTVIAHADGKYDSNGDGTPDTQLLIGTAQVVGGVNSSGQAVVNAGTLTQNANGTFTFVPATGFTGEVTYTYTLSDDNGGTDTATVTIYVNGGNTTFATDDVYILAQGVQINGNVLSNDYDAQGDSQTVNTTPVTAPQNGILILNANGSFTYTPNPGFTGTDQFVYEVCDNGTPIACKSATVYLNISTLPDVSPTITIEPSIMIGITNFYVTVRITEMNSVNTNGTITVRIPRDTRWVFDGAYNPNLTTLGTTTLNNNVWSYTSNSTHHIFTTNSVISAGSYSYFGFRAIWNAGQTKGIFTISSQIVEGSGGENRIDNNVDAEKIDYFIY